MTTVSVLKSINRIKRFSVASLSSEECESLVQLAFDVLAYQYRPGAALTSPKDTCRYLRLKLAKSRNEHFGVLFLDNRNRILADEILFNGTIDGASVYPRVLVQRSLEVNAAALVLYHNHPSGVAEPSRADKQLTRRLIDACAVVDIRVLDHLVVTATESVSFADNGLL